jgi:hypothetical protein
LLVTLALTQSCARSVEREAGDATTAHADAISPADARAPDDALVLPDGCSSSGEEIFYERGYCFAVDRCCTSADCEAAEVCNERGHCVLAMPLCGCASDWDCRMGSVCFDNDVACGVCLSERPSCTAAPCDAGLVCRDGHCVDPASPCDRVRG